MPFLSAALLVPIFPLKERKCRLTREKLDRGGLLSQNRSPRQSKVLGWSALKTVVFNTKRLKSQFCIGQRTNQVDTLRVNSAVLRRAAGAVSRWRQFSEE